MDYDIVHLSPELLRMHLEDLLVMDEATMGEKWERQHFLLDLPGKWECSWIVLDGERAVGFVIVSMKPEGLHVHRIAVASSYQGQGLGTRLLQYVAQCAVQRNISRITLRVAKQNTEAIGFYHRLGFHQQLAHAELLDLATAAQILLAASSNQEMERR